MVRLLENVLKLPENEQIDFIVGTIEGMSVMGLAALIKRVESRFGVKASTTIVQQSTTNVPNEVVKQDEQTEFAIFLKAVDAAKKIATIKEVRAITGLGLKEAKDLVDAAPKMVKEKMAKPDAENAKKLLEAAGATVELR